jgi:hypothetical protein
MLRFAPRYGRISPCLVRPDPRDRPRPANDNPRWAVVAPSSARATVVADFTAELDPDELLAAALRLFAAHGLAAAQRACEAADIARRTRDEDGVRWWLAVAATLDRRKAHAASRRLARQG